MVRVTARVCVVLQGGKIRVIFQQTVEHIKRFFLAAGDHQGIKHAHKIGKIAQRIDLHQ